MKKVAKNSIIEATQKCAEELGLTKASNTSWRKITPKGIRCIFLDRSNWHEKPYYDPSLGFYPIECLQLNKLPRKRPMTYDYPVQFRFDKTCGWNKYKEKYERFFDMSSGLGFEDRYTGIKELITTYVWPVLEEMSSLDDVVRMEKAGQLPPGAVRMPVLARIDPEMRKRLVDYRFIDGEFRLEE